MYYRDRNGVERVNDFVDALPPERPQLHQQALEILDEYLDYVDTDTFIEAIDSNPFTPVSVREPLEKTLSEIARQLRS